MDDPTATVRVTVGGQTYTATTSGYMWSLPEGTISPALGDGRYTLIITATDVAGNVGTVTATDGLQIDTTRPTSRVDALAQRQTGLAFTVTVSGSDPVVGSFASGVVGYDIYFTNNGGPWTLWRTLPVDNPSATFIGQSAHSYGFRSVARDAVGNVESKTVSVEGGTYVPDLSPPDTAVIAVDSGTASFLVRFQGTDPGGSGVASFQVLVSIDGGAATAVSTVPAGTATGGVYAGSLQYQAIADGTSHSYRFYTLGADTNGNVEAIPTGANQDVVLTASFAAPGQLAVTAFKVQKGQKERSFVRYVDLTFNQSADLAALVAGINDANPNSSRIRLLRYGLDGSGPGVLVALSSKVQAVDHALAFDFGVSGLGGSASSNAADGYYELALDLDGNGTLETVRHFYRLLGDVNGDRLVDAFDLALISAAMGKKGPGLEADVNGDGVVNANDRLWAAQAVKLNRRLADSLWLDG